MHPIVVWFVQNRFGSVWDGGAMEVNGGEWQLVGGGRLKASAVEPKQRAQRRGSRVDVGGIGGHVCPTGLVTRTWRRGVCVCEWRRLVTNKRAHMVVRWPQFSSTSDSVRVANEEERERHVTMRRHINIELKIRRRFCFSGQLRSVADLKAMGGSPGKWRFGQHTNTHSRTLEHSY